MKEIKTVALVGLGAIGAYFADRLQPVLGDDLRVIAGGARAERIRREGLVINGKQEYYHVVEPGEGEPADLVIFATKTLFWSTSATVFPAAGGLADGGTVERLAAAGKTVADVLQNNDAYHALRDTGDLIITGPTGTNVNDFAAALVR